MTGVRCGFLLAWWFLTAAGLAAQDTRVVLLRHAERQSIFDGDSPLAEAGRRRADALVPLLAGYHPAVLYTSDLRRTRQTLAPTAAQLGLIPFVRPKDGSAALAAEILRDQRGRTVVVCWHHDLMKKVVRALGVKGPVPHWSLDSYDRIWIVTIPAQGEARLVEQKQQLAVVANEVVQPADRGLTA